MAAATAAPVIPRFVRIFFVRHGQSYNNTLLRVSQQAFDEGRLPDPPLTKGGRRQANAVGHFFARMAKAGTGPESVVVSPMLRALETAKPIVAATGAGERGTAFAWPPACECGGVFSRPDDTLPAGKACFELTKSEVETLFPGVAAHESITEAGWWASKEKEDHEDTLARCMAACKVMRGWADAGEVRLPPAARFEEMQGHMKRRLQCQRDGKPFDEADVAPFAHEPDPAGAGGTDADVAAPAAGSGAVHPAKGGEESHPGPVASVAVVCHHDFIDKSIALLTNGDAPPPSGALYSPEPTLHFCFHNCSVSVVDLYPGGTTRVVRVNDVRHLDPVYTRRQGLLSGFWQDPLQSPPETWDGEDDDEFETDLLDTAGGGAAP